MIEYTVSDKKILKLAKRITKNFDISIEDSITIIYKESDLIVSLFLIHKKGKDVYKHFIKEIAIDDYLK